MEFSGGENARHLLCCQVLYSIFGRTRDLAWSPYFGLNIAEQLMAQQHINVQQCHNHENGRGTTSMTFGYVS